MNQYAELEFLGPSIVRPCTERRAQLPLVLGERAFDVDPLPVDVSRESALELTAIATPGPLARTTHVDRGHQGANAQELPAEFVMMLAVVSGVGQDLVERHPRSPFHQGRGEVGGVVAGALAHLGGQPKIAPGVAEHRQLGEGARPEVPGVGTLAAVVETHMPGFVPGRIDRSFGLLLDQATAAGAVGHRVEQSIETPFFRKR